MSDAAPAEKTPTSDDEHLPSTLESLEIKLARLTETVAALDTRVAELVERRPGADSKTAFSPIDWASISGAARAQAWRKLGVFVEGLVSRYSLQEEILPCWWRHGEAVEELTSLWQARNVAYAPGSDASMASWWQDLLERSRMRLRSTQLLCRHGHTTPEPKPWMSEEELAAFRAAEQ